MNFGLFRVGLVVVVRKQKYAMGCSQWKMTSQQGFYEMKVIKILK